MPPSIRSPLARLLYATNHGGSYERHAGGAGNFIFLVCTIDGYLLVLRYPTSFTRGLELDIAW